MKPFISRISGLALVSAAVIGLIFSLSGLVLLGVYSTRINANLMGTLDGLSDALAVTAGGLDIAHGAVMEADTALGSLAVTLEGVNTSLTESRPSLESISDLLGTELPNTIRATQDSLESAETSAKNIDNLLTSLSKIPFLGSLVYNPKVPLNKTIGDVSDSLNEIPEDLINAQKGMDLTIETMDSINLELGTIAESTTQIRDSTTETIKVIEDYQVIMDDFNKAVEQLQTNLPRYLRWATAAAVLFLLWLGLAQIGLLIQGSEMVRRSNEARNVK